jgi:hypothetical protein
MDGSEKLSGMRETRPTGHDSMNQMHHEREEG